MVMLVVLALGSNLGFLRSPLDIRLPDVAVPQTVLGAWIGAALWRWPASGSRRLLTRSLVVIGTVKAFIAIVLLSQMGTVAAGHGPAQRHRWRRQAMAPRHRAVA